MTSYLDHWQLAQPPFRSPAAAAYPAPPLEEALARIEYLAADRHGVGALLADRGMGKSTVLVQAARNLTRQGTSVALVDALGMTARELLWQVACGLDAQPVLGDSVSRLWHRLADTAAEHAWRRTSAVVLVDDAGQAGIDLCHLLVRLVRTGGSAGTTWTLVLAATPGESLRWPESLRDLIDLKIELDRWDEITSMDFVQHALMAAGRDAPVFTEDALHLVHHLAEGVPRHVARVADLALVQGATGGAAIVDTGMVEAAYAQVRWDEPARS